jgi:hypothetical protein
MDRFTVVMRRLAGTGVRSLIAPTLVAAAVLLPGSLAAAPDPALSPELQTALAAAMEAANGTDATCALPPELLSFLEGRPGSALDVARFAAARTGAPTDAPSGESGCGCALRLASVLGSARPEQASEIRETLASGKPECGITVTEAIEESLAATSSGGGPKPRPQQGFALTPPGGGGGGGNRGGCRGNCTSVEPPNDNMASHTAF